MAGPEKAFDGVQDIQPENTAPWHSEDFKLKESEKMVEAHTLTLLLPFCPENRTENPPVRGVLPAPRKRASLSPKIRQRQHAGLAKCPGVGYTYLVLPGLSGSFTTADSSSDLA